ncbi:MAG: asparagine synthase (glutamine-hydrolyzing) [Candidatus Hodarchaeota archaeon]
MCGIVGIFNTNGAPVSPAILRKMTDVISHRGPDGEGFYTDSFIGLGHRRLAILDPSPAGHQPMITEDGSVSITYNGEVYNFREIRAELEAFGYGFRSNTDTEVVLNAFHKWGEGSITRFNGIFAFAVWDKRTQTLTLARDRYGTKPLYYHQNGETLLFASEIKSFLHYPDFKVELDFEALYEYFTFQNIFTDRTLFKGVNALRPGHILQISLGNNQISNKEYWDFDFKEMEDPPSFEEAVEELNRLFCQAVQRQLVSDVEIGSYLSGGIDSGAITAIAANNFPYIKTFCIGFDLSSASGLELGFDEREKAEMISAIYKTEHYEMVLKSGDMERCMEKLVWHLEDPRVGQSYPNFYAAKLAGKFVKVVLAGTGGDELFGGYPWRYYRIAASTDFGNYIDNYYLYWQRLIPNRALQRVFSPVWDDVKHVWTRDIFEAVLRKKKDKLEKPDDYVNYSLYLEAKTFLHGLLLVEDKLSMAHSLEARLPFLDNDLVDFAMGLPVKNKLRKLDEALRINENEPGPKRRIYFDKTRDGKIILKEALRRYVPEGIVNQEKQGFTAPDESWFRGESIEYMRRMILDKKTSIFDYMDYDSVKELVFEHLDGRQNRRLFIWSLLNFELWLRTFLS